MFIYLQNSSYFFHIYKVLSSKKLLFLEGKQVYGLSLVNIKYISSKKAHFVGDNVTMYEYFLPIFLRCKLSATPSFIHIFLVCNIHVELGDKHLFVLFGCCSNNFVNDNNHLHLVLSNGFLHILTWNGEVYHIQFLVKDTIDFSFYILI